MLIKYLLVERVDQPITESLSECPPEKGPLGPVVLISLMAGVGRMWSDYLSVWKRVVLSIVLLAPIVFKNSLPS